MRSSHKAQALAKHDAALELVLEHHRGAAILEASGGDPEHALRIIESLKQAGSAEVIRLPREPILDFRDVVDPEGIEPAELVGVDWRLAIGLGLVAWAVIAAIAFATLELVRSLA